jgi:hypothetical protein
MRVEPSRPNHVLKDPTSLYHHIRN